MHRSKAGKVNAIFGNLQDQSLKSLLAGKTWTKTETQNLNAQQMLQRGVRPWCKHAETVKEVEFKPAVPEQIRRLFLRLPGCNWIAAKRGTLPVTLLVGRVSGPPLAENFLRYAACGMLIFFFLSIEL